jgi:hypothetical protein
LCVGDAVCGTLVSNATCVNHPSCGASKVCDVACRSDSDCGSVQSTSCVQGFCRGQGQVPSEAGVGTGGADASIRPEGKSTGGRGTGGSGGAFAETGAGTGGRANGSGGDASIVSEASPGSGGRGGSFDDHPDHQQFPGILGWDGGGVACGIPGTLAWTLSNVATADRHQIDPYIYERTTSTGTQCSAVLPFCSREPGITMRDVGIALVDADVQKALRSSQASYGSSSGPSTLAITIDGHSFTVGDACDVVVPECAVPPGLVHLRELLLQVEKQQQGRGDCRPSSVCYQPVGPGPCAGNFTRYGYNPSTGKCETFSYGGCGGNGNRFDTKEECEATCDFDPCFGLVPEAPGGLCSGIAINERNLCAPDPDTACACSCSASGQDIGKCYIFEKLVDGSQVPAVTSCQ